MQKLGYSRAELFIQLDKPALKPLPEASYSYTLVKKVRVHADYHVEIDKHYYSVPCSLLGQQLEAWISGELVGGRLENGKYPTLRMFFVQTAAY
ncbi:hypothetical protein C3997_01959 [Escherichia coli]|nr:hypothetical protein C3997_01959 [Escherichia coli]RDS21318.1 hypothetical protein C3990_01859 [Escherichia coli]